MIYQQQIAELAVAVVDLMEEITVSGLSFFYCAVAVVVSVAALAAAVVAAEMIAVVFGLSLFFSAAVVAVLDLDAAKSVSERVLWHPLFLSKANIFCVVSLNYYNNPNQFHIS